MSTEPLHHHLLNDFQRDFPLVPRPYAQIAERLGTSEERVLELLRELSEDGRIGRVGAVFAPNRLGISTLAALAVPESQLPAVANWISALPEVNHNYEREHPINLWFVLNASDRSHLERVIAEIEKHTGLTLLNLPLLEEFHIDLGFPLDFGSVE